MSGKKSTLVLIVFCLCLLAALPAAAQAPTLLDEWSGIAAPPAPVAKPVFVNPANTAFLILDIQTRLADPQARPRAAASVPRIQSFLAASRANGLLVVYSLTRTGTAAEIVPAVAPQRGDPVVRSGVDKFFRTDLEKILKEHGIQTVVIAGTAAHGAVLHTATGAALRDLAVILPVDGMSADTPYAEQYTAWHMLNAPGTRNRVTLTTFDQISFLKLRN